MADGLDRTVHSRVVKTDDVEIHVSTLEAPGGGTYVEIREYVVSLDQYGRGLTFPSTLGLVDSIDRGLQKITEDALQGIEVMGT